METLNPCIAVLIEVKHWASPLHLEAQHPACRWNEIKLSFTVAYMTGGWNGFKLGFTVAFIHTYGVVPLTSPPLDAPKPPLEAPNPPKPPLSAAIFCAAILPSLPTHKTFVGPRTIIFCHRKSLHKNKHNFNWVPTVTMHHFSAQASHAYWSTQPGYQLPKKKLGTTSITCILIYVKSNRSEHFRASSNKSGHCRASTDP